MTLTSQQLKEATTLHDSGVTWEIIAALLKTTTSKLRRELKDYDQGIH